ncbi:ABC transporter permease [Halomonas salipaludis]|uniref:ABC transporter permease n=1 Tax=Halomonas salipaludis TaxID=2032625 RepID=A0A2A2ETV9_9GAMM|nr:ABC transporter permease subunit [Halomonas salipaludis]PAU76861.1 ABC transporter permease [Halomonas salipaludis]
MDPLSGYGWMLISGFGLTLGVAISSMIGAILIGLIAASIKFSRIKIVRLIVGLYTTVIRGVPELVLLLLVYYGLPTLIQDIAGNMGYQVRLNLNPFIAGIATLSFIYGAFACEALRSAYLAIPKGQHETIIAFGFSRLRGFVWIIAPQLLRYALPALGNVWLVLLKATALISIIQLPELMRMTDMAARATRQPFTFFLVACLAYLLVTLISMWGQKYLEQWASKGIVRGAV